MRRFVAGSQGRAIAFAAIYSVLILAVALIGGNLLHEWARQRIMGQSSLSVITDLSAYIQDGAGESHPLRRGGDDTRCVEAGEQPGRMTQWVNVPALNVLLLGTDARPDEADVPRTDTMILASLDPQSQSLGLLSLPRDLWLPIPGLGFSSKINTAYQLGETEGYPGGGPQLAKDTVSSFIGQPVQYFVRVNFQGFVELVDLIGGVDVVVPATIHDDQYPTEDYGYQTFHLDAGVQHLDGETALKYVRTRNIDDDYSRARRQQQVIRAVADKVLRADMLPTLLPKLPRLLYTRRSSIETDIPMAVMLDLANYARGLRCAMFGSLYWTTTSARRPTRKTAHGSCCRIGHWCVGLWRTSSRRPPAPFSSSVAQLGTDWIRIEVLNGTGEPG